MIRLCSATIFTLLQCLQARHWSILYYSSSCANPWMARHHRELSPLLRLHQSMLLGIGRRNVPRYLNSVTSSSAEWQPNIASDTCTSFMTGSNSVLVCVRWEEDAGWACKAPGSTAVAYASDLKFAFAASSFAESANDWPWLCRVCVGVCVCGGVYHHVRICCDLPLCACTPLEDW